MTARAWIVAGAIVSVLVTAAPVRAHHAFAAEFDANRPVLLRGKVTKVDLRREAWVCDDPVWWRPLDSGEVRYVPLTDEDRAALAKALAENGRPPVGPA